jgi:hypothetical protein
MHKTITYRTGTFLFGTVPDRYRPNVAGGIMYTTPYSSVVPVPSLSIISLHNPLKNYQIRTRSRKGAVPVLNRIF